MQSYLLALQTGRACLEVLSSAPLAPAQLRLAKIRAEFIGMFPKRRAKTFRKERKTRHAFCGGDPSFLADGIGLRAIPFWIDDQGFMDLHG